MSERRFFGTDGVRGRVGTEPMTPERILKLGWAAGRVLASSGRKRVLIGKDTRVSGYMFESALEAGFSAAGADVRLLGPMPTPAIAYLTRTFRASAGVVISASHNPFEDNGVKFFSSGGEKLPDEVEAEIEAAMSEPLSVVAPDILGKAQRVDDAPGRYIEFCKSTISLGMSLAGLRIVVDCAHGATYHVAPRVLRELGAEVIALGTDPDGFNINDAVGSTAPDAMRRKVLETRADLGIALDGDGDRVVMADEQGNLRDGDYLLYVIARDRAQCDGYRGGVVGTLMSNLGLEQALAEEGVPFERARVGDRYVLERLRAHDWLLGGEASGHLVCLDRTTTGDGIVAALQVLAAMRRADAPLSALCAGMVMHPQVLRNVRVEGPLDLAHPRLTEAVRAAEARLDGRGRVLLRASGTEPLVRVMVEGADEPLVERLAGALAEEVAALAADDVTS
ncbi:MAG: phosphoglucosamine mutase [Halothiobacillaceae bacterium]